MLVLTRKHQEKIRIGDNITITVLKTKGKAVRLGIEAPAEVSVIRAELLLEERGPARQPQLDGSEGEVPRPMNADAGRMSSRAHRTESAWPAKTEAAPTSMRPPGNGPVRVSLQRVPREQVSQVLPSLASGSGPLRAMLDRRSVTA